MSRLKLSGGAPAFSWAEASLAPTSVRAVTCAAAKVTVKQEATTATARRPRLRMRHFSADRRWVAIGRPTRTHKESPCRWAARLETSPSYEQDGASCLIDRAFTR